MQAGSFFVGPSGALAREFGNQRLPLKVMRSAAGYYLGTQDPEDGSPYSRESVEYWPTESAADQALTTGEWTQRDHP